MSTHGGDDASSSRMVSVMSPLAILSKGDIPQVLPIFPIRNSILFPGGVLPLAVGRQKSVALLEDAVRDEQLIGVVTQRQAGEEDPGASDLYAMGTVARLVKVTKMDEDRYSMVVQGLARFRVLSVVEDAPYLRARVESVGDQTSLEDAEVQALGIELRKVTREVIALMPELPPAATQLVESVSHPGHLADLIAANLDIPLEEKQAVLETVDLKPRMNLVIAILALKREILILSKKIDASVEGAARAQAGIHMRQQLIAIQALLDQAGASTAAQDPAPRSPQRVSWPLRSAPLRCSFCEETQLPEAAVFQSRGFLICEACVRRCNEMLAERA